MTNFAPRSKRQILWGRILHVLISLFLIMDVAMKLLRLKPAVDATVRLGFQPDAVFTIGLLGLVCLILYLIPRTALIGALLWTAYLGGAVAIQIRVGAPLFDDMFPVLFAVLLWLGLWLRDSRVDAFLNR